MLASRFSIFIGKPFNRLQQLLYMGIAIMQDPADAEVTLIPENALHAVETGYCATLAKIGPLLVTFVLIEGFNMPPFWSTT